MESLTVCLWESQRVRGIWGGRARQREGTAGKEGKDRLFSQGIGRCLFATEVVGSGCAYVFTSALLYSVFLGLWPEQLHFSKV